MKHLSRILGLLCLIAALTGCETVQTALQSPDATATLSAPHVLTERGLIPESEAEPGSYAVNQVIEPGTYARADLERLTPSPLPETVTIHPGQSPSALETGLVGLGTVANTIPGGQPFGALLLGLVGVAKIWRDKRRIDDLDAVARTLARSKDAALDSIAMLPDRQQAQELEAQIEQGEQMLARKLGKARELLDAILSETATPTKRTISRSSDNPPVMPANIAPTVV